MYSQLRAPAMIALIVLSACAVGQSQTSPASAARQKARSDHPVTLIVPEGEFALPVPPGENAWVIQMNTGGGIMGTQSDSLIITSAGEVTCNGAKASAGKLSASELLELSQLVAALNLVSAVPLDQRAHEPVSLCSDCAQTALVLSRRDAKNKIKTYFTAWDAVTFALLPEDFRRLYENASRLSCHR